jgi:hypothetical protein
MSLRASVAKFLTQPISQSGPLSALIPKENALKNNISHNLFFI